jgi:hypothetical protein
MTQGSTRRAIRLVVQSGLILVLLALLPTEIGAATMAVGVIQFNTFTPANPPDVAGVNMFLISNYTGVNSLHPDFPVDTAITFQSLELVLAIGAGTQSIPLSDIGPGDSGVLPELQFTDTLAISSATLIGTFSTAAQLTAYSFSTALMPSVGTNLVPDSDLAVIYADTVNTSAVPEPATLIVISTAAILFINKKRQDLRP